MEMPIEVDGAIRTQIEGILKGETEGDVKNFLIDANKEFITDYKEVYSKFFKRPDQQRWSNLISLHGR